MVSWIWIPFFMLIGVFVGIFLIALVSAGREKEEEFFGKDWKQMDKVLKAVMDIEDKYPLSKEEQESFDVAVLCVSHIMNRLRWQK